MQRFLFILFLMFTVKIEYVRASGECSNDAVYDKFCAKLDIISSYQCAMETPGVLQICYKKAFDIMNACDMSILKSCATPQNDSGNLFELCLAEKASGQCQNVGKKYS